MAVCWLGGGWEGGRGADVWERVRQGIEFPEWRSYDSATILCSFSDSVFTIVDSRDTSPSRERKLVLNSDQSVCSTAASGPIAGRPHRGSSCSRWLHCVLHCGGRG